MGQRLPQTVRAWWSGTARPVSFATTSTAKNFGKRTSVKCAMNMATAPPDLHRGKVRFNFQRGWRPAFPRQSEFFADPTEKCRFFRSVFIPSYPWLKPLRFALFSSATANSVLIRVCRFRFRLCCPAHALSNLYSVRSASHVKMRVSSVLSNSAPFFVQSHSLRSYLSGECTRIFRSVTRTKLRSHLVTCSVVKIFWTCSSKAFLPGNRRRIKMRP